MPRRWRRWHGRTNRDAQNRVWIPTYENVTIPKNANVGQDRIYKICDFFTPNTDFDFTLERMRGQVQTAFENDNGSGTLLPAVLVAYVHQNKGVSDLANGAYDVDGMIPDPMDHDGPTDFPLIMDACNPVTTGTALTIGPNLPLDSKAKRRMSKDDNLTLFIKFLKLAAGSTQPGKIQQVVNVALRCLYRLKV